MIDHLTILRAAHWGMLDWRHNRDAAKLVIDATNNFRRIPTIMSVDDLFGFDEQVMVYWVKRQLLTAEEVTTGGNNDKQNP